MKLKNDDRTWRLPRSLETQAMDFAIGGYTNENQHGTWNHTPKRFFSEIIFRIHAKFMVVPSSAPCKGYQIKSASLSEWRTTDQQVESKKILLHPSKHAKHEFPKQPHRPKIPKTPSKKSSPSRRKQKRAASLSENLAGWVLSSLHGPGDMPPFESQRLPRKYCAAPPIRSVAPRIDRAPKHGHLSCPYIWWSSKPDLCLVKKVRFANPPGKKKTSRRLWIYHVRKEKREQKIQGFSKTRCHRCWSCSPVAPWNLSVGGVEYAFALALAPTFLCMIFRCEAAEMWKNPGPMFCVFLWGSMPFSLRSHVWQTRWCPWNCPPLPTGNDLLTSSLVSIVERITKSDRKSRIVPLMVKVDPQKCCNSWSWVCHVWDLCCPITIGRAPSDIHL